MKDFIKYFVMEAPRYATVILGINCIAQGWMRPCIKLYATIVCMIVCIFLHAYFANKYNQ